MNEVKALGGLLSYDTVFTTVYTWLRINLCLIAAGAPVLAALAVSGAAAWPFTIAIAALCAPAAAAAFEVFSTHRQGDAAGVFRPFWSAYRRGFGRSLAVGVAAAAAETVLGVDLRMAASGYLAAAVPMLAILMALVLVVAAAMLVGGWQETPWWRWAATCAYLCIRRWYLSLANLLVLGVFAAAVAAKPAVGIFLLPAPAMYVVWANTRRLLHATR